MKIKALRSVGEVMATVLLEPEACLTVRVYFQCIVYKQSVLNPKQVLWTGPKFKTCDVFFKHGNLKHHSGKCSAMIDNLVSSIQISWPWYFNLFGTKKEVLRGQWFYNNNEREEATHKWLKR